MATADTTVKVNVKPVSVASKVEVGLSTYMGVILTILGAAGSIAAAIKSNDTATITAGASTIAVALTTIGGRMAQAVAVTKTAAQIAAPIVQGVADMNISDDEADEVHSSELPSDEEEFADAPSDDVPESAVHPDVPR